MFVDPATLRGDWNFPTTIRFGPGRIAELPDACRAAGIARPLLVTDPGLASLVKDVLSINESAGLATAVFSDVRSNPVAQNIVDGVDAFISGDHDGVIAFGGGSALDAGKVIAMMAHQDASLWEVADAVKPLRTDQMAPVVAVPTTAGTGSEVGRAAVITDAERRTKRVLFHPSMMPRIVIADPKLTIGLPPHLTAATGMDALAHCLEAFCAPFYHPIADGIALEGMRLVKTWLPLAVRDGSDLAARSYMLTAATMGAAAFQKGLGAIHALSHPLGAHFDIHHGLANAVLMPYVVAFNRPAIEGRMALLAHNLTLPGEGTDAVLEWLLELRHTIGIPHTLADLDVPVTDLERLAGMAADDPCAPENPVSIGPAECLVIYRSAFEGRF